MELTCRNTLRQAGFADELISAILADPTQLSLLGLSVADQSTALNAYSELGNVFVAETQPWGYEIS